MRNTLCLRGSSDATRGRVKWRGAVGCGVGLVRCGAVRRGVVRCLPVRYARLLGRAAAGADDKRALLDEPPRRCDERHGLREALLELDEAHLGRRAGGRWGRSRRTASRSRVDGGRGRTCSSCLRTLLLMWSATSRTVPRASSSGPVISAARVRGYRRCWGGGPKRGAIGAVRLHVVAQRTLRMLEQLLQQKPVPRDPLDRHDQKRVQRHVPAPRVALHPPELSRQPWPPAAQRG